MNDIQSFTCMSGRWHCGSKDQHHTCDVFKKYKMVLFDGVSIAWENFMKMRLKR